LPRSRSPFREAPPVFSSIPRSAFSLALAAALCSSASAQNQALSVSNNPQGGYIEVPPSPQLAPASFTLEAWLTYDDSALPAGWVYPTIARKEFTQGVAEWLLRVNANNTQAKLLRVWIGAQSGVVN